MEIKIEKENYIIREKCYEGDKLLYEKVIGSDRNLIIEAEQREVQVNTSLPITVTWGSFEGEILTEEEAPIKITVEAEGANIAELELTPISGVAGFDFVSEVIGIHTIKAEGLSGTFTGDIIKVVVTNA